MMYKNKLVAAIKVGGKVLREFKESVRVPFGAEYHIYLKNLNSVRASITVTIDGKTVINGLQLGAGQEVDLQRSVVDNNFERGNSFKFIERTSAVEKTKGIGAEDGVVRIEYQFEKVFAYDPNWPSGLIGVASTNPKNAFWNNTHDAKQFDVYKSFGDTTGTYSGPGPNATTSVMRSSGVSSSLLNQATFASASNVTTTSLSAPVNDAGITVPGSINEQKFVRASQMILESEKHVVIFHLTGEVEGQQVAAPVTVKTKPKCVTCGTVNKATTKFCKECGTSLQIV